jgi:hypothetical protein
MGEHKYPKEVQNIQRCVGKIGICLSSNCGFPAKIMYGTTLEPRVWSHSVMYAFPDSVSMR